MGVSVDQMMVLVPRSPTPRANCSRSPEMAPDGLGAVDLSPTVELYAARNTSLTASRRACRSGTYSLQ